MAEEIQGTMQKAPQADTKPKTNENNNNRRPNNNNRKPNQVRNQQEINQQVEIKIKTVTTDISAKRHRLMKT